jgi:hypothetical protein
MTVTPILPPTKQTIVDLLDELPPESLATVETFIRFVHTQAHQGRPVVTTAEPVSRFRYPTVPVPPSSLDAWMNLLPTGYDGDALADTEALYDEV